MRTLKIMMLLATMTLCNLTIVAQETKTVRDFPEKKTFVGLHAGVGPGFYTMYEEYMYMDDDYAGVGDYYDYYGYFSGNIGVDVAIPVSKLFYIGPYASIGMDLEDPVFGAGVLMMFNLKNESAIMASYGFNFYHAADRWLGDCSRVSYKFPNKLYIGLEAITSSTVWEYNVNYNESYIVNGSDSSVSLLFHIGLRLF